MKVVFDTNILVSACWTPDGLEARVLTMATSGQVIPCVSPAILAEYRDVLSRPKLASIGARATELLAALERNACLVEPTIPLRTSIDDDDNRFLECALAASAEFLITGNLRHYPAVSGSTRIVNARAFLTFFENRSRDSRAAKHPAKVVL
jgi:putative PIN family toxin of toxin-antitoxin system